MSELFELTYKEACDFITMECTPSMRNLMFWNEGTSPEAIEQRLMDDTLFVSEKKIDINKFIEFLLEELFGKNKYDLGVEANFKGKSKETVAERGLRQNKVRDALFRKLVAYKQSKSLIEIATDLLERANYPYSDQWDAIESTTERVKFISKSLEPNEV